MGKIMIQIRIAMGIDTLAYSNFPRVSGITGNNLPSAIPTTMQAATHTLKYLSKNDIPCILLIFIDLKIIQFEDLKMGQFGNLTI
jgi:hypothetical protein